MSERKRVAILISGRGSNMHALIEASHAADYPANIVGVISNMPDAQGLKIAQQEGLPTVVHQLKSYGSKILADQAITQTLEDWNVEFICLAGFMRILGDEFATRWMGKMINIHPSLLPKFKGLDTHQRAIDSGEIHHGCSVHFVVPELDAGPVFLQTRVPVMPEDTAQELANRVLEVEHRTYRDALKALASGDVALKNGELVWSQNQT